MNTKFTGLSPEQLAVLGAAHAYKVAANKLKAVNPIDSNFGDQRAYGTYLIIVADAHDAFTKLAEACSNLPDDE